MNDFQRNGLPAHQFITERESFGDNCSIVYLSYWDGKKIGTDLKSMLCKNERIEFIS